MDLVPPVMLHVLLVEDSDDDALAIRRALAHVKVSHVFRQAHDADSAMQIIRSGTTPLSNLLLLVDVHLPRRSGLSLIGELRANEVLRHVPVVVLSGSERPEDLERARQLNVAGYFLKPKTNVELARLMETIVGYWSSSGLAPLPRSVH